MGMQERDWYQRDQRQKEYEASGLKYRNSLGWHYMLNGHDFGPCDKDNICRLMREHTLNDSTLVKQGSGPWTPISKLRKEFPKGGYIYQTGKHRSASSSRRDIYIAGSPISVVGIVLGIITFLICYLAHTDIGGMIISTAFSVVMPGTIRSEWEKGKITVLGVLATIVLVINLLLLGLLLYSRLVSLT
jgi:hypothetical protein